MPAIPSTTKGIYYWEPPQKLPLGTADTLNNTGIRFNLPVAFLRKPPQGAAKPFKTEAEASQVSPEASPVFRQPFNNEKKSLLGTPSETSPGVSPGVSPGASPKRRGPFQQ